MKSYNCGLLHFKQQIHFGALGGVFASQQNFLRGDRLTFFHQKKNGCLLFSNR